jgi:DNA-binding SARP family transcriptional activator
VAVEFRVLGEVAVRVGGRDVDAGHARQRCVLAALLVDAGRVVSADALLDRVWADDRPRHARNALSGYVSRLRGLLPAEQVRLGRENGGYRLRADPLAVDLHRFRHLVTRARAESTEDEAVELFDRALGLWRGSPFATLDTPWANELRDALETERLAAELDRNDLALRLGRGGRDGRDLTTELATRAAAYPLDERVAGQLMLALYRDGRQADALRHYQRLRATLADELGADPSPPLRALHHRILTADTALVAPRTDGDRQAEAGARRGFAIALAGLGEHDAARRELYRALQLLAGDYLSQARVHMSLARTYDRAAQPAKAIEHGRCALELYRSASVPTGRAHALNLIGWCQAQLRDPAALAVCEQAVALHHELGDRYGEAASWDSLGYAHHQLGEYPRALDCFDRAAGLHHAAGERFDEATVLAHLGDTHCAVGDPDRAVEAWRAALAILTDLGHPNADRVRATLRAATRGHNG